MFIVSGFCMVLTPCLNHYTLHDRLRRYHFEKAQPQTALGLQDGRHNCIFKKKFLPWWRLFVRFSSPRFRHAIFTTPDFSLLVRWLCWLTTVGVTWPLYTFKFWPNCSSSSVNMLINGLLLQCCLCRCKCAFSNHSPLFKMQFSNLFFFFFKSCLIFKNFFPFLLDVLCVYKPSDRVCLVNL